MPRQFWGYYDNGTYRVGCNGATIWIYDQNNVLLKRFHDIPYTYCGAFQPGTNIFVAKSTAGLLAVYDLDKLECRKTIHCGFDGGQDEGFAFFTDAEFFYNIQKPAEFKTEIGIYRTKDYQLERRLFSNDDLMVLDEIEFSKNGECYVLGFMRDVKTQVLEYGFVGRLCNDKIAGMKKLSWKDFDYYNACLWWKRSGFSDKVLDTFEASNRQGKHLQDVRLEELYKSLYEHLKLADQYSTVERIESE